MESPQIYHVEGLGLCEHCKALISIQDLPVEALKAEWHCPKCRKTLSGKSFGYDLESGKKIFWVGKNREWVTERPKEDFSLGNWHILIIMPDRWLPL